jgi:hypothetical protein
MEWENGMTLKRYAKCKIQFEFWAVTVGFIFVLNIVDIFNERIAVALAIGAIIYAAISMLIAIRSTE